MTKRTLRRRVIIREYDYKRVREQALGSLLDLPCTLYDRAEFMPLNQENLEKLKMIELLKGKQSPLAKTNPELKNPALLLFHLKDYLYDKRYIDWNVDIDEDGYLCVQSRKNTPRTRLGWAVFEKDYESKL